jgi:hypothetical protein
MVLCDRYSRFSDRSLQLSAERRKPNHLP